MGVSSRGIGRDASGSGILWRLTPPHWSSVATGMRGMRWMSLPTARSWAQAMTASSKFGTLRLANPQKLGQLDNRAVTINVSPNGRLIVAGDGGSILMWNPVKLQVEPVVVGHHPRRIYAVGFMSNGHLVTGGSDGALTVWDPDAPGVAVELGHHSQDSAVRGIVVLADDRVVSSGWDGQLRLWNPAKPGSGPRELGSHDGPVAAVAVLQDGRVVSGGTDGRVRVWDTHAATVGDRDANGLDGWPDAITVLPDGRAVTASRYGRIVVWDPATTLGEPVELGRHRYPIFTLATLTDGRLASGGRTWRPLLWDPSTPGVAPVELGPASIDEDDANDYSIEDGCSILALADGRLVTHGGRWVRLWDVDNPSADLVTFGPPGLVLEELPNGHPHPLVQLPDGRVVSAHDDAPLLMWNPSSPQDNPRELGGPSSGVTALATLPDNRLVSADTFGRLQIWDPNAPGTAIEVACLGEDSIDVLAALPDGRIISGSRAGKGRDGEVRVWDCPTERDSPYLRVPLLHRHNAHGGPGAASGDRAPRARPHSLGPSERREGASLAITAYGS